MSWAEIRSCYSDLVAARDSGGGYDRAWSAFARVSRRRRSSNASAKNAAKAGSSGSRYFGDAIGPLTTRINKIHAIRRRGGEANLRVAPEADNDAE